METQDTPSQLIPEEFLALADDPESLTSQTAARFGVSPHSFINWRWQMKHQVADAEQASAILQLKETEERGFSELKHLFNAGITPYYMGLMLPKIDARESDCPIRLQALPRVEELKDSLGVADPLSEVPHS